MSILESLLKKPQTQDRVFHLTRPQAEFIRNDTRYPAFVSGWGTGKTAVGIGKSLYLSEKYPGNLGVIFRKEYTDLRDSTVKDFEDYTGFSVSAQRDVKLPNGSIIMFRHLEEMNNIQNMNLGWFWIEQAEELETDDQFFKLFGRLRRANVPHAGFITANTNGHNWIWKLWKMRHLVSAVRRTMIEQPHHFKEVSNPEELVRLYEAKTQDNAHILDPHFLASLEVMKAEKPRLYNRFVLNSWDDADMTDAVIPSEWIDLGIQRKNAMSGPVNIGVDVGRFGDDPTIIFPIKGRRALPYVKLQGNDTMQVCGRIKLINDELEPEGIYIDTIGIGSGVFDRCKEMGLPVFEVNVAMRSTVIDHKTEKPKFKNLRSEVWWRARESLNPDPRIQNYPFSLLDDSDLREQLATPKYTLNSAGQIEVESKDDMKERLGHSPDIADAYCLAAYGITRSGFSPASGMGYSDMLAGHGTLVGSGRPMQDWMR